VVQAGEQPAGVRGWGGGAVGLPVEPGGFPGDPGGGRVAGGVGEAGAGGGEQAGVGLDEGGRGGGVGAGGGGQGPVGEVGGVALHRVGTGGRNLAGWRGLTGRRRLVGWRGARSGCGAAGGGRVGTVQGLRPVRGGQEPGLPPVGQIGCARRGGGAGRRGGFDEPAVGGQVLDQ
jgi:hypothetical protein